MPLLQKSFIIMITVGLVVYLSLSQLLDTLLIENFTRIEEQTVNTDMQRAQDALWEEVETIHATTSDWATFDDAYHFMLSGDPGYVTANLPPSILENLNMFSIVYFNGSGQIVEARTAGSEPQSPPKGLQEYLAGSGLLRSAIASDTSGILVLPEGPLVFSACPILDSDGAGPASGVLFMARRLDEMTVTRLNGVTKLSFSFSPLTGSTPVSAGDIWYQRLNNEVIDGFTTITDWQGQPVLLMELTQARTVYQNGLAMIDYFSKAIGFVMLVFSLLVWLLLRRWVIRPIEELGWNVLKVGQQGDFSGRVPYEGSDEVAALAKEINHMLAELEETHQEVAQGRAEYQELFESALSANYVSTPEGRLLLCNHIFLQLIGYDSMEQALATDTHQLYENKSARQQFLDEVKQKRTLENRETKLITRAGEELTVLENVVGIFDDAGDLVQIRGFMLDITSRKQAEEAILYLSHHDQLTGLHNRYYLEQELPTIDIQENLPLSVIVIDVNGLKLVNDALGHASGDLLLKRCAEAITTCCRPDDLICRWGGDEFLVLLPKTAFEAASAICQGLKSMCDQIIIQGITTSASIGAMTKEKAEQHLADILKEAEERMYREKLLERASNRHSVILTLEKSLFENTPESQEHIQHLQANMVLLGHYLDLPEYQLDELKLLAALHDIGKVAIPEHIFHKNTDLTPEEQDILKKHSEIGYRIARSIPEMSTVAEAILCHHERWDGKGYPLGLAGEAIPLHARIISIVNTFDVFFYGRRYQPGLGLEDVIAELRGRAGADFDPKLVEAFVACLRQNPAAV